MPHRRGQAEPATLDGTLQEGRGGWVEDSATKVWSPHLHTHTPVCLLARGGLSVAQLALATAHLVLSEFRSLGQVLGAGQNASPLGTTTCQDIPVQLQDSGFPHTFYSAPSTMGIGRPLRSLLPGQSKGLREPLKAWPGPGRPVLTFSAANPSSALLRVRFRAQAPPGSGRSRLREAPPPARPRPGVRIRGGERREMLEVREPKWLQLAPRLPRVPGADSARRPRSPRRPTEPAIASSL